MTLYERSVTLAHRAYKLTLSPLIGRQCRFLPTCSDYAREALIVHGPFAGGWLGFAGFLATGALLAFFAVGSCFVVDAFFATGSDFVAATFGSLAAGAAFAGFVTALVAGAAGAGGGGGGAIGAGGGSTTLRANCCTNAVAAA